MRRLTAAVVIAVLAVVASPAEAKPRKGPCVPGQSSPRCLIWPGKVVHVDDGDTFDIDIARDGSRGTRAVRLTGVNAQELTRYANEQSGRRGECHGLEAVARSERLIEGERVRVSAIRASSRSGRRIRRSVAFKRGGRWTDLGSLLVREGHALWLPGHVEYAWNRIYSTLAARAAAAGRQLYDDDFCGQGPSAGAQLRLWVNWDAEGGDASNINDEWIRIKNLDPRNPVPLGGWSVRDSDLRRYDLPSSAVVPAGGTITVHMGRGSNSATSFFWGLREPPFENVTQDAKAFGDGAYLFDPQGDIRALMLYPCRVGCTDPLIGAIELEPSPRRDEFITVRNVSGGPVDLEGYRLQTTFHGYAFPAGSAIGPGEELRLETQGDPADDTRLLKHWGFDTTILRDNGDAVEVVTYTDIRIACAAWGRGNC
jgi:endonuclease YncB( thermonuclease family)